MKIETQATDYKPRSGSTAARAIQALYDGPLASKELGLAIDVPPESVNANLGPALNGKAIVKIVDETGLLHFALPGMELDDRFKPYVPRPVVNVNDPFNLVAKSKEERLASRARAGTAQAIEPAGGASYKHAPTFGKPRGNKSKENVPPSADADDFVAGLMSNGQLSISSGGERITLSKPNTVRLVGYLEKVAGLL